MQTVALPDLDTARAWREAARGLLARQVPPEDVLWQFGDTASDLFAGAAAPPAGPSPVSVPKSFLELAQMICWHRDPERFARLYALLWRLRDTPGLMSDRGDPALAKLRRMEKEVSRDRHKMKAFLRFREITEAGANRRRFAAWFEPDHFITEPLAPFFARRFGDMDWVILTPHRTAEFRNGAVSFAPGTAKPPLPEDATEALWTTYFQNIFNPARLKLAAMRSEMPKKYWKNLPEAAAIPGMIEQAEARARAMQEAAPTLPPLRAGRIIDALPQRPETGPELRDQVRACTRCPLHCHATQAVPGEGPLDAPLMIVGEQPGDQEDLAGRPFVGPAGQLFDRIAHEAGLDRSRAYLTNAVKHFKFTPRGKRRIHQRPDAGEVQSCRWWLDAERALVRPKLVLAMGATAAASLTGTGKDITRRRGTIETLPDGTPVLLTLHPSYLLRLPDDAARQQETARFRADLRLAGQHLEAMRPA